MTANSLSLMKTRTTHHGCAKQMNPKDGSASRAGTSVDWKSHPLRCHHPSYLPTHGHPHLHPVLSNLRTTQN